MSDIKANIVVGMDFGTTPSIALCGVKHTDLNREQLIQWVEHLDWHIGNLTERLRQADGLLARAEELLKSPPDSTVKRK